MLISYFHIFIFVPFPWALSFPEPENPQEYPMLEIKGNFYPAPINGIIQPGTSSSLSFGPFTSLSPNT